MPHLENCLEEGCYTRQVSSNVIYDLLGTAYMNDLLK